jgi:hypothetical protein
MAALYTLNLALFRYMLRWVSCVRDGRGAPALPGSDGAVGTLTLELTSCDDALGSGAAEVM